MRGPAARHAFGLRNDPAEIERLAPEVEGFGARHELPPATIFALNLALEEVVTNIIAYGYDDGAAHVIDVELRVLDGTVTTTVEDDGRPFDPLAAPEPDVAAPLEEREIGGVGVLLVRRLMDEVTYARSQGRNRLTFTKQLAVGGAPPAADSDD
jgi:serine/threonine-protein kinase RsbW